MAGIGSLPLFHQVAGKPVLVLGVGEAAEARRRLVERAGGLVAADIDRANEAGVRLAFVALEDDDAARTMAEQLRAVGMLVNVTDRPDLCDFTVPSIVDRNPVLVAVGTGGASAGLAKHLRLRLEKILPQSLGLLAQALFGARDTLRRRLPDAVDRRRAIDEGLREGGTLDPLDETASGRVEAWAGGAAIEASPRTETIVLTSLDPDDLTIRQARLLGEADALILDGKIPDAILARARADAIRLDTGSAADRPGFTLRLIAPAQAA